MCNKGKTKHAKTNNKTDNMSMNIYMNKSKTIKKYKLKKFSKGGYVLKNTDTKTKRVLNITKNVKNPKTSKNTKNVTRLSNRRSNTFNSYYSS